MRNLAIALCCGGSDVLGVELQRRSGSGKSMTEGLPLPWVWPGTACLQGPNIQMLQFHVSSKISMVDA
jgi:hypothetical protein